MAIRPASMSSERYLGFAAQSDGEACSYRLAWQAVAQGEADGVPEAAASTAAPSEVEVPAALCGNRKDRRKAMRPAPEPEARVLTLFRA